MHARIVRRVHLHYSGVADPSLDRPEHVRAGSGLAWIGSQLAVVQDDANFVAVVDPSTGSADFITLPPGPANRRQFADSIGNKPDKFDFEAITLLAASNQLLLVGSGSSAQRERIALIDLATPEHNVSILHLPDFYSTLRRTADFAGSEMNIEGVLETNGMLRLFGRGNGAAGDSTEALDASCDVDIEHLFAHMSAPHLHAPPEPVNIMRFELGTLRGMRLSFTDGALLPPSIDRNGHVVFLAAAEDSPNATQDGDVTGSVIGIIDYSVQPPTARYTEILDEHGESLQSKAEGIAFRSDDPRTAYIVLDVDAADQASELCEVRFLC